MVLVLPLCVALLAHQVFGVNVAIPLVPPSAAATISPSLFSFSIEQDRWTDWVGSTSRNQFFFNTLDNLGRLTGVPPQIRVGADSEDRATFNAAIQTTQLVFPAITPTTPYPEATNSTVGDTFFRATQFLPPNTHVIWGLNFGQNNITTAFLEAKSIAKAFASPAIMGAKIVLDAIEIGNEADFYGGGARPTGWNMTQYVKEWTSFATNVSSAVGISSTSHTKFWGGAFALSSHSTSGFSPQSAFSQGLTKSTAGSRIATFSQHHYSGSFCAGSGGLLQDLMTKSTIRGNLTSFKPDITATRALGLDYVLGETNSYACHGAPGVSNSAGAALWGLDYALFATQIGISRVFFHQGLGYKYNHIQPAALTRSILDGSTLPSPLPAHVQPTYYGAIVAAEAIGKSGSTRAVELSIDDIRIAGYAFFEGTKLVRALFINSNAFLRGASTRASTHLDLSFTGTGRAPTTVSVKRLKIGHADDQSGLTWGGQSYETSGDGRPSGPVVMQTGSVSAGVDITATEAVLVSFH
ncbi:glycoside hydrolase family 79 protein [Lyophyllum atratum]|nr:glycoside hydrolase family 79 protein [Lyophyllum atratum]